MELQKCHGGKFLIIFLPYFSLSRSLKFVSIDAGMRTPMSQRTLIIPFQLASLNDPFCSIFQKIISHHLFCHQSANKAVSSTPSSDHIMRSLIVMVSKLHRPNVEFFILRSQSTFSVSLSVSIVNFSGNVFSLKVFLSSLFIRMLQRSLMICPVPGLLIVWPLKRLSVLLFVVRVCFLHYLSRTSIQSRRRPRYYNRISALLQCFMSYLFSLSPLSLCIYFLLKYNCIFLVSWEGIVIFPNYM